MGRRAGPTKGGWVGLEKLGARRRASVKLKQMQFSSLEFLMPRQSSRVALRVGPYSLFCRFCRAALLQTSGR